MTIGELAVLAGPVLLADYDPAWATAFERDAARIRGALGDRVKLLEHVGSTSVPGLAAKPIIDMVLAVPDSTDEDAYVPPMEAAGYVLRIREPEWFEHRLFKGSDPASNIHVFTVGLGMKNLGFPNAIIPQLNDGVPAVLFCFAFLYIASRGAGIWSVDGAMGRGSRR